MRDRSETIPRMIREWSENETVTPQPASQPRLLFTPTTGILYWKIQHFALRLSFQISPNTAPATKSDTSTSPNTAPATQNDSHDQSATHLKRYLQCAEQQVASSNITKYCACHAKWLSNISKKFLENSWNVISNAGPIREWSEQETVRRNPPRNRGYFSGPPRAFCIEKYNISRSGYHSKFHRILRLPRKVTLQLHRILRLPRKMTVMILSWLILVTYETLFTMRGTTGGILQHHQILRLPRKMILQNFTNISPKQMKRQLQCATDPSWIRAGSEPDPRMIRAENRHPQPASQPRLLFRTQIFQSTLVLFDPCLIRVFFFKKIEVFFLKNKGIFFVYMALSFCQHIVIFWIFHVFFSWIVKLVRKIHNSIIQLNLLNPIWLMILMSCPSQEFDFSIPYLHFTISFSHLMFQICSIHNFWYLGFMELTCQNYWYMLFPNFLNFENFRFISQFLSQVHFFVFSDLFLRKWNLNFIFGFLNIKYV